ncbi:flavin reductase family protein [Amphibacillus jilinensis]|uniref:flavin reductase family protein n=1 Tax=Amphibacillus jilinensis TaxID=1216008 RepID=UPI0002ED18BD|nr:flavin reductase family protein [Amphibacillus jilinensis]
MTDTQLFRQAMGQFSTGITVITAKNNLNNEIRGITVNAFMSLSLDPMLIAISLRNQASMISTIQQTDHFGISILAESQKDLSMIFANQKKNSEPVSFDYIEKVPVIPGALVHLICEKENQVVAGDHTIFIAKVNQIDLKPGKPLVYYGGSYHRLTPEN